MRTSSLAPLSLMTILCFVTVSETVSASVKYNSLCGKNKFLPEAWFISWSTSTGILLASLITLNVSPHLMTYLNKSPSL